MRSWRRRSIVVSALVLDARRRLGAAEARDRRELLLARLGELLERAEAEAVHAAGDRPR